MYCACAWGGLDLARRWAPPTGSSGKNEFINPARAQVRGHHHSFSDLLPAPLTPFLSFSSLLPPYLCSGRCFELSPFRGHSP